MSAHARRPQVVPDRGLRVALISERRMADPELKAAMADLDRIGWTLASVVAPERFGDALRMLLAGMVDRVVVLQPEDFPVIAAADLAVYATEPAVHAGRTRMLPRAGAEATSLRQRRPEPAPAPAPETRHADTDSATARPNQGAKITQQPARSANAGAEFSGTRVPNPGGGRRASEQHGRSVAQHRRRRIG